MQEWEHIEGFEQWEWKLRTLLTEAGGAARDPDIERRFAVARRLTEFIEHSTNDEAIAVLDGIASRAANDLMEPTIDERLAGLAARGAEIATAHKVVGADGKVPPHERRVRRLAQARAVAASITGAVGSLREYRRSVAELTAPSLGAQIEDAIASLRALRDSVELPASDPE